MGEELIEAEAARVAPNGGRLASRREPLRRYPVRKASRLWCVIVLLLSGMSVLAGCQNQSLSNSGERRDGFYGGVSGGLSRP
jgi:hypothetical protein